MTENGKLWLTVQPYDHTTGDDGAIELFQPGDAGSGADDDSQTERQGRKRPPLERNDSTASEPEPPLSMDATAKVLQEQATRYFSDGKLYSTDPFRRDTAEYCTKQFVSYILKNWSEKKGANPTEEDAAAYIKDLPRWAKKFLKILVDLLLDSADFDKLPEFTKLFKEIDVVPRLLPPLGKALILIADYKMESGDPLNLQLGLGEKLP
jgi:hypothetical protein